MLPNGDEVNRDAIIAMMTAIIAEDYPGGTIVTDSVTSEWLIIIYSLNALFYLLPQKFTIYRNRINFFHTRQKM